MSEFVLKALEFGVLGLCAITLVLVWRVLQAEQRREGNPRRGILQATYVFMAFCSALALVSGYLQLRDHGQSGSTRSVSSVVTQGAQQLILTRNEVQTVGVQCPDRARDRALGMDLVSEHPLEVSVLKDAVWFVKLKNTASENNKVSVQLWCEKW